VSCKNFLICSFTDLCTITNLAGEPARAVVEISEIVLAGPIWGGAIFPGGSWWRSKIVRQCEAAHTPALLATVKECLGARGIRLRAAEGVMLKRDLWSSHVPRVEIDQRARASRLRFERLGPLPAPRARLINRWRRLLRLLGVAVYGDRTQEGQIGVPQRERRGCRMPPGDASVRARTAIALTRRATPLCRHHLERRRRTEGGRPGLPALAGTRPRK
jgi:hypothetical protein